MHAQWIETTSKELRHKMFNLKLFPGFASRTSCKKKETTASFNTTGLMLSLAYRTNESLDRDSRVR